MKRVKLQGSQGPARPKTPEKGSRGSTWKLFFITDEIGFEADFVLARTAVAAKRAFSDMYGGGVRSTAELVMEIDAPPAWLEQATWLGPDHDALEELGGKRVPSIDFPRWQFGDRVWGPQKTARERYSVLARAEPDVLPLFVALPELPGLVKMGMEVEDGL